MKNTHKPVPRIAWILLAAICLPALLAGAQQLQGGAPAQPVAAVQPTQPAIAAPATAATAPTTGPSAIERAKEIGGEAGIEEATGLGQGPQLFADAESIRTLLGENPRWVWHVEPGKSRPDPMLIPWVAERLLFDARDAEAAALIGAGKLVEALEVYHRLQAMITEATYRTQIEQKITELETKIEELRQAELAAAQGSPAATQGTQRIVEPVLPQAVQMETWGIIHDQRGGSAVGIGEQLAREGDEVEGAPGVVVKSIGYQTVVFTVTNEFMSKDFEVKVIGDLVPGQ